MTPKLIPVILAGGVGSRLWPVSREDYPKPFIKLFDGCSLIEKTYTRALRLSLLKGLPPNNEMYTVTNRKYYFMCCDVLDKVGASSNFLLEPFPRNTGPAISMIAHALADKYGDDVILLVMPSDHIIHNEDAFHSSVINAYELACSDYLVTFGIKPNFPETGFGYLQRGNKIKNGFGIKRFVEKPNLTEASCFLNDGGYSWNSGMLCFSARTLLNELKIYEKNIYRMTKECYSLIIESSHNQKKLEIPENIFNQMPNISIDHCLMEKSKKVACVEGNFGWSDVGSWDAVKNLIPENLDGNSSIGEAIFIDTKNVFVRSENRIVATLGVENLMIIDTSDALLVANINSTQDVKVVTAKVKELGLEIGKSHKKVNRPWGAYSILEEGPGFKIKRISVKAGASLSLQYHLHRSEHWVVVKGEATITNGNEKFIIQENQSNYIPAGNIHRLQNNSDDELVLIEVQCGSYLGEDDIVRVEDIYGRC